MALYYTYGSKLPLSDSWRRFADIAVPAFAVVVSFYLAWKSVDDENDVLKKQLTEAESKKPNLKFKVVDARGDIKHFIKEVEGEIEAARVNKRRAPLPHPFMPSLPSEEPDRDAWERYEKNLIKYKDDLEDLLNNKSIRVRNILITNEGATDKDIRVEFKFKGIRQVPDFWADDVVSKKPGKPTRYFGALDAADYVIGGRLGERREVHENTATQLTIEIEKLRKGSSIMAHDGPLFFTIKNPEEMHIEYSTVSSTSTPGSSEFPFS